jgi:hypothetical protein
MVFMRQLAYPRNVLDLHRQRLSDVAAELLSGEKEVEATPKKNVSALAELPDVPEARAKFVRLADQPHKRFTFEHLDAVLVATPSPQSVGSGGDSVKRGSESNVIRCGEAGCFDLDGTKGGPSNLRYPEDVVELLGHRWRFRWSDIVLASPELRQIHDEVERAIGARPQLTVHLKSKGADEVGVRWNRNAGCIVVPLTGPADWQTGNCAVPNKFTYPSMARALHAKYARMTETFTLEPGSALAIPRGMAHAQLSVSRPTLYLTIERYGALGTHHHPFDIPREPPPRLLPARQSALADLLRSVDQQHVGPEM